MIILSNGISTCTIDKLADQSSWWSSKRTNSASKSMDSGNHSGFSLGRKYVYGVLVVKMATPAEAQSFEDFILANRFSRRSISIVVNGGAEVGGLSSLSSCFWNGENSTESYIIPLSRKVKFDIMIPYITFVPDIIVGFGVRR